ncbi:MAG TPA: peptide chain release factor N(5)-glutamine methyltransferase [Cerasibacillus sp.]|uniref:peptide chain release factor N(5)-glutamine methyltransferase n=1 Tax=Cerasibacillus sp. TaxID=2498711 RepID=UPI002F3E93D8
MKNNAKQYEVLKWASLFLKEHQREPYVAEILLQHYLNISRAQFLANMRDIIPVAIFEKYKQAIYRHAKTGIPVQHIIGKTFFYGREFHVTKDVLIPRMETEELVQCVLKKTQTEESLTIVDLGTGSGVIAITLALESPHQIFATDLSDKALEIAQRNAASLEATIHFYQGDFLQPIIDQDICPDVIVSNPPYIARKDASYLSDTVKDFDPALALFADHDGLKAYETIVHQITKLNNHPKQLFFEIGYNQGEAVAKIIRQSFPIAQVSVHQDINGKDRIIHAQL